MTTEAPTPNGCRWCGVDEREHLQRWTPSAKWHQWVEPTDEQRKERMLARRAAATAGDDAAVSTPCMACGTIGVRPDTRLCEPCIARPYGTVGGLVTDVDECAECWEPRYVWYGNTWGLRHKEPGRDACGHDCHESEIGLAASGAAVTTFVPAGVEALRAIGTPTS